MKEYLTEEEVEEVRNDVRTNTINALKRRGVTLDKVVLRLKQSLDAKDTKAQYDKDIGKWVYSAAMINHRIRLDATKLAFDLYGAMPSQKVDVEHGGGVEITVTRTVVDGGAKE